VVIIFVLIFVADLGIFGYEILGQSGQTAKTKQRSSFMSIFLLLFYCYDLRIIYKC
jgi:hypothetical protein